MSSPGDDEVKRVILEEVAQSHRQWTGIAVMPDGQRVFVNFPRWSDDVPVSLGLLDPRDKSVDPFPNAEWNHWDGSTWEVGFTFVCVQSVVADRDGYLWVLDNGNPRFSGNPSRRVIPGAPKLLKFDTRDGRLLLKIPYIGPDILPQSYLNDVRIDTIRGIAYLTDSGKGAIIVTDLQSGISHRLLDDHFSVEAEAIDVVIDGKPWRRKDDGGIPRVHADGIALSPDNTTLYFQALTGRTLYRISTAYLVDFELTPEQLGNKVEKVGVTGPADGIDFAPDGTLYLTSLEDHAVKRLMSDGTTQIVVQHHLLEWPDSFAMTGDGTLYITTSRIHLGQGPYSIFRFKP